MASADDAATWHCRGGGGNATLHFREDEYHCLATVAATPAAALAGPRLLSVVVVRHPVDRIISQWW
jgi:hypothetical protein